MSDQGVSIFRARCYDYDNSTIALPRCAEWLYLPIATKRYRLTVNPERIASVIFNDFINPATLTSLYDNDFSRVLHAHAHNVAH